MSIFFDLRFSPKMVTRTPPLGDAFRGVIDVIFGLPERRARLFMAATFSA